MKVDINKERYVVALEKALTEFYKAKTTNENELIEYHRGFCKGMISIFKTLDLFSENEIKEIITDSKLSVPTILR
ncbi:MAG: hypothetical protein JXQ68_06125 [Campylobacterales bacterium]|nr:hypothetical protein [Campylobacterales bacterium]